MIDPAHHIAENPLRVIVELFANFLFRKIDAISEWRRQQLVEIAGVLAFELLLTRKDIGRAAGLVFTGAYIGFILMLAENAGAF